MWIYEPDFRNFCLKILESIHEALHHMYFNKHHMRRRAAGLRLDCLICLVLLTIQVPTANFMAVTKIPRNSKDLVWRHCLIFHLGESHPQALQSSRMTSQNIAWTARAFALHCRTSRFFTALMPGGCQQFCY